MPWGVEVCCGDVKVCHVDDKVCREDVKVCCGVFWGVQVCRGV